MRMAVLYLLTAPVFWGVCTDDVLKQNYPNQNMCELMGEIPSELKNLPYAIYPSDGLYNTARFNYNKRFNLFPHAIIAPRTASEMVFVLRMLRQHKLEFSLRSGGHCYEPGSLSSGYIIDLKNFNSILPNVEKQEVFVGAGCLLGQVIETLGAIDYAMPTGDCPVVGVTGLSLGGGQGVLTRAYGMTCDSIKSITLLTADGEIVEVNDKNKSDLFWALRGAGNGSYGIVLGLTFKMYPIPKTSYFQLTWDFEPTIATRIIQNWQSWLARLPHEITTHMRLQYADGAAKIAVSGVKMGGEPFDEWKEPFESLQPHVTTYSGRYVDTARFWVESHVNPFSKSKSVMIMEPLTAPAIDLIIQCLATLKKERKPYKMHFTIASLGGQVTKGDTAFFPRTSLAMWHQMVTWGIPEEESEAIATLRDFHAKIAPLVSPYCYANVVDYDLGTHYLEAYYGTHVDRLIKIKKKYDPTNLFHWKQSIPTTR